MSGEACVRIGLLVLLSCFAAQAQDDSSRFTHINLASGFNQELDGNFHNATMKGSNLSPIPRGKQTFCGIPFHIGNGCLHLGSDQPNIQSLPREFGPFDVDGACRSIHFLHSAGYARPMHVKQEKVIGEYVIQYADGKEVVFDIVAGVNIRDWLVRGVLPRAASAWRGRIERGGTAELFVASWKNPHPDKIVRNVRMRAAEGTIAAPFCLAITTDKEGSGIDYQKLAIGHEMDFLDGAWERRRQADEEVNWVRQVMTFDDDGSSTLASFDGDGKVLWKNQGSFSIKYNNDVRTIVLTDIRGVAGGSKGASLPGPFYFPYTTYEKQLVTAAGLPMSENAIPRMRFWTRLNSPE